jgi:hypothetical protein
MKGVQLAAELGIDPALITRYKRRGMPTDSFASAKQWMGENLRPRPRASKPRATETTGTTPVAGSGYLDARTSRERAEARLAQLRALEAEGLLVNRDRVRKELAQRLAGLRQGLLQIPARLQSVLAAETDEVRCHDLLHDELLLVLQQFVEAV